MSIVNKLKALKGNLFGGKGNTGETRPPASTVQSFDLQSSPTGILDIDPLAFSTMSYPLDVQNNFQNGHYMLFYVNVQDKTKYVYDNQDMRSTGNEHTEDKESAYDSCSGDKICQYLWLVHPCWVEYSITCAYGTGESCTSSGVPFTRVASTGMKARSLPLISVNRTAAVVAA